MSKKGEQSRENILMAAKQLVMQNGFAGTSIDDILKAAGVSKGAFFHHFRSKAHLASELVRWHAGNDIRMFRTLAAEAEAMYDDPYDQLMKFLTDFEAYISNSAEPSRGCMYAVYTYESEALDEDVNAFVAETLQQWSAIYIRKFQEVIDRYPPVRPVSARQLSEMIVSLIEGGLILQRAYGNTQITARQSEHFRDYLDLLFAQSRDAAA
ncbi:TetR/AcrR family transcriptional regulator [Tropicimonas isoalkanivorans]|uniref:Transcriptional regulator, TetR family n=1 Tax=Tropicimonas isoalkanivorans TaxID=441112 RepID=A0A1I1GG50_9RHOB|nr:TetR/AcrR family transcriptional regulator [Tropicimonas isoalkanivorans]SFC08828.1 transcriptional regulator, TetR family [Tropicimonas isoalkanivorans]